MRCCTLEEAADEIDDGDLLLFRGRGWLSTAIAWGGRSAYSHAARAARWEGILFCCEVREWYGGRAVTLASQLPRYPDGIDVFEANPDNRWPEYDRRGALRWTLAQATGEYGYRALCRAVWQRTRCGRLGAAFADEVCGGAAFCSQACAAADRLGGGVDPTPHLADGFTEPGDLARSLFYRYRCTLSPRSSRPPHRKERPWIRNWAARRARCARWRAFSAANWATSPTTPARCGRSSTRCAASCDASTARFAEKEPKWG